MTRLSPSTFACASALLLGLYVGCGHGGSEATFEGCTTDENLEMMNDLIKTNRIKSDPQAEPQFTQPMAGATLPSSSPPTFRFQPSATNVGSPSGDATCPQFQPTLSGSLKILHLPAVSGTIFDLQITVDGAVAYRVLTTQQSTSVPAGTWTGWAGKRISVTLYSARLLNNEVAEGPYRAAVRELQVGP